MGYWWWFWQLHGSLGLLGSVSRVGDLLFLWEIWGIISVEWLLRAVFWSDSSKFRSISRRSPVLGCCLGGESGCFGRNSG